MKKFEVVISDKNLGVEGDVVMGEFYSIRKAEDFKKDLGKKYAEDERIKVSVRVKNHAAKENLYE